MNDVCPAVMCLNKEEATRMKTDLGSFAEVKSEMSWYLKEFQVSVPLGQPAFRRTARRRGGVRGVQTCEVPYYELFI
jgi:hypothetical protein